MLDGSCSVFGLEFYIDVLVECFVWFDIYFSVLLWGEGELCSVDVVCELELVVLDDEELKVLWVGLEDVWLK